MELPKRKDPNEKKPNKVDGVIEELQKDKKEIERTNFLGHLRKSYKDGRFRVFKHGIGGIIDEYRDYTDGKDETLKKYLAYETVVSGATDSVEYYILLVLSCLIATFGLYQNSPATIIGAMIVAPFMGPIFGFSAGLLWGSGKVIRISFMTILKGLAIVIAITALLTLLIPDITLTNELLARSKPTLFDIIVAICCGFVGAYAYVNNRVVAAIPGVAISVALMPPACTIGIGLGMRNWQLASGASLLFSVNLFGIMLAGLIVFYFVRLHPRADDEEEMQRIRRRAASGILGTLLLLVLIAVPLVYFMIRTAKDNANRNVIRTILQENIADDKIYSLEIRKPNIGLTAPGYYDIEAVLLRNHSGELTNLAAVESRISNELKLPVRLNVYSITSLISSVDGDATIGR